jgi:hypothetical protein
LRVSGGNLDRVLSLNGDGSRIGESGVLDVESLRESGKRITYWSDSLNGAEGKEVIEVVNAGVGADVELNAERGDKEKGNQNGFHLLHC